MLFKLDSILKYFVPSYVFLLSSLTSKFPTLVKCVLLAFLKVEKCKYKMHVVLSVFMEKGFLLNWALSAI